MIKTKQIEETALKRFTSDAEMDGKQAVLVSGTTIKTVNGTSLLGSGDVVISAGSSDTYQSVSILSGDTAKTIDFNVGNVVDITASNTSNCTLAFLSVTQGKSGTILITASGGERTILLPSASPNCRLADNYGRTITIPNGETWVLGFLCRTSTEIAMFLAQKLTA